MSVTQATAIPNTPSGGGIHVHPLGGNGFSSPHSVYHVKCELASDASGGYNRITLRPDPRYVSLFSQIYVGVDSAAADVNVDISIIEDVYSRVAVRGKADYLDVGGLTEAWAGFSPAPFLVSADQGDASDRPYLRVQIPNVNGQSLLVYTHVFNFDKRARELVPIEAITRILTRSETLT